MLPQQEVVNFVVVTCFISAKIEKFYETLTTEYIFFAEPVQVQVQLVALQSNATLKLV